jgi:hypothetical protein
MTTDMDAAVSASDWSKGISLSILASIIGGASKLAIRKSWLMEEEQKRQLQQSLLEAETDEENADAIADQDPLHQRQSRLAHEDEQYTTNYNTHDEDKDVSDEDDSLRGSKYGKLVLARLLRGSGMIGMTLLNPLACVLAMNYASPSILAPFSGLTLVWIVLLSNPVIGEQPTDSQIMAACLIVFGEIIVAVFGDHTNDEGVTVEDVVRTLYSRFLSIEY